MTNKHGRPTIPARYLYRQESRPDIDTQAWLNRAAEALEPRPGFVRESRRRIQSEVTGHFGRNPILVWKWSSVYWWQSPTLHIALVILLVTVGYFNVMRLSQASRYWIPGDWLYPLKTVGESVLLTASLSPEHDAQLHITFAQRRLLEAQSLAFENRYEQIPATVASFDYHVTRAVTLVGQLLGSKEEQARGLAGELEAAITDQMGVVGLLHGFTPDSTQAEFERLMSISAGGVTAARRSLSPNSSQAPPTSPLPSADLPNRSMILAALSP